MEELNNRPEQNPENNVELRETPINSVEVETTQPETAEPETTSDVVAVTEPVLEPVVEEVPVEEPASAPLEAAETVAQPEAEQAAPLAEEPAPAPLEPEETVPQPVTEQVTPLAEEPAQEPAPEPVVEEAKEEAMPERVVEAVALEEFSDNTLDEEDEISLEELNAEHSELSREQLVEKLEKIVQHPDINAIKTAVASIKVAYIALTREENQQKYQDAAKAETEKTSEDGEAVPVESEAIKEEAVKETEDPIEERFKTAFNKYKENKHRFTVELEKEKQRNLEAKTQILEELKVLINSDETLKKTYDDFKLLQEKWKSIGVVPKEASNGLWQNYHFYIEKFFDKVKINRELRDLDLKKNLEQKIALCEKAEDLLLDNSIIGSFKKLQDLHDEWKEIGPVANEKRDEIWDRFKTASDKINQRRREHYDARQGEFDANYAAKVALCVQAEEFVNQEYKSLKDWQNSTNQINDLLKVWKTIGPTQQKVSNEVWTRFKSQLDAYFKNKKEYFDKLKEQQLNNYNLKLDLCQQAEAHRLSSDWRNSSKELVRLQNEWKNIGPVPRKHSDKIWKRFRGACDEFFTRKAEFFKDVIEVEQNNLRQKVDLIAKLTHFEFTDDRQANIATVKELQREWMEIGHVPIKEKERLFKEYKSALDKIYDKLKLDSMEIAATNYKARFENLKDQPDAHRVINKEKNSLQNKIDQVKEEILLWENNIGFFANSKQANALKQEFENKIARAKEELARLQEKMKFLHTASREQAAPKKTEQDSANPDSK